MRTTTKAKRVLKPKKITEARVIDNEPNNGLYTASIKNLGQTYRATGATAKEAIANLKPSGNPKGMSILTVTLGKVSKDKVLNHAQTFRLFSASRLMREVSLKSVGLIFDNI